jgi:hypothetical protein
MMHTLLRVAIGWNFRSGQYSLLGDFRKIGTHPVKAAARTD